MREGFTPESESERINLRICVALASRLLVENKTSSRLARPKRHIHNLRTMSGQYAPVGQGLDTSYPAPQRTL